MEATPLPLLDLSNRIAAHLQRNAEADQSLATLLADTASQDWQRELCQTLLSDDSFAAEVAARSYRHGNGFLKVVLLERDFKLRLHLWLPGTPCEENIHDHRWSIASTILAGELHSEIWADAANDADYDLDGEEFLYRAARDGQPAGAEWRKRTPLRLTGRTHHQPGDSYALPTSTLHRICNHGDRLVATLMCSSPAVAGHTRLIAGQQGLQPSVAAQRLGVPELRAGIACFASLAQLPPANDA